MWPFNKKLPQRRLEVRKGIPAGPGLLSRFRASGGTNAALLAAALLAAALLLDSTPLDPPPYRPGGYLPRDVYARVGFRLPADDVEPTTAPATAPSAPTAYKVGELLARRTARGGLSEAEYARLVAEHDAWRRHQNLQHPLRRWLILLGRAGMIAVVVALLAVYVNKYEPAVVRNFWRGLAIVVLLVLMLLLTRVASRAGPLPVYVAVFPIFLAAAILTIAFDQRFALALTAALVVLATLQMRAGLGELIALSATAATVFLLREVRTRSKIVEIGFIVAGVVFVAVWLTELAYDVPPIFVLVDSLWAAACAIVGGFIVQGILPLVERIFQVATSMTLLEWCDANRPLLNRLNIEAPGTYNHSLLLGTMCEAAAEAIGARGLLARVGAYYHDIGKIHKPHYFGENQVGGVSPHDKLSPAMSLLLIKGHVKDGVEMAKEYGLPRVLHEFIATHHGTTLVEYFYHAAAEQRRGSGQDAPEEVEFRYPGPKPQTKEAAILMLADACESSVRAMSEPTAGRIETQAHNIVTKRLTDGQLDDCEMTLREVHAVEASLVKSLCAVHHARVAYPSQRKPDADSKPAPTPARAEGPAPDANGNQQR